MSYQAIKEYYNRIWAALQNEQPDLAKEILHEQMPASLYDMSLDICYNYNPEFSDQELRQLIRKVDRIIHKDINEDIDDDSDVLDMTGLDDPKTDLF